MSSSTEKPISKKAFAALLGVEPSRVSQYLRDGLIGREALVGHGRAARILPTLAQSHLHARLEIGQRKAQLGKVAASPPVETEDDARAAVQLVLRVLREEGVAIGAGDVDYAAARLAKTILEARDRDLRIAERRKNLVPLAAVKDHVAKAFVGFRQTLQRMPSRFVADAAAELGCDAGKLEAVWSRSIAAALAEMAAPVVRG